MHMTSQYQGRRPRGQMETARKTFQIKDESRHLRDCCGNDCVLGWIMVSVTLIVLKNLHLIINLKFCQKFLKLVF